MFNTILLILSYNCKNKIISVTILTKSMVIKFKLQALSTKYCILFQYREILYFSSHEVRNYSVRNMIYKRNDKVNNIEASVTWSFSNSRQKCSKKVSKYSF